MHFMECILGLILNLLFSLIKPSHKSMVDREGGGANKYAKGVNGENIL
jgi:hypothetical protein